MEVLLRDGGVIIVQLFPKDHVQETLDLIETYLPSNRHDFEYETPHAFFPQETKLLWSLAARGDSVRKRVCFHPLLKGLRDELLHMGYYSS